MLGLRYSTIYQRSCLSLEAGAHVLVLKHALAHAGIALSVK